MCKNLSLVLLFHLYSYNLPFRIHELSSQKSNQIICKGRVKIYRVPGPGPSTGGRRLFFEKKGGRRLFSEKIRGAETFFRRKLGERSEDFLSEKIRGAKTFFQLKKGGRRLFFRQIFPKTRPRYFDRSLRTP